jgi:hypothetical protein
MIGLSRIRRPFAALLLVMSLPGCGLILNGTRQSITANSTPEAARVTTAPATGEYSTPIVLRLERKLSYSLRFDREGYSPATVDIQKNVQAGIVVLDILFGLVPLIVDAATGAWYKLEPASALVVLTRVAQGDGPAEIHVGISDERDGRDRVLRVTSDVPGVSLRVEPRR